MSYGSVVVVFQTRTDYSDLTDVELVALADKFDRAAVKQLATATPPKGSGRKTPAPLIEMLTEAIVIAEEVNGQVIWRAITREGVAS